MPKQLVHPLERDKKVHPLRAAYAKLRAEITEKREAICTATGWSQSTFYEKVTRDAKLTEREAKAISPLLSIPINDIDSFQRGYAEARKPQKTA